MIKKVAKLSLITWLIMLIPAFEDIDIHPYPQKKELFADYKQRY